MVISMYSYLYLEFNLSITINIDKVAFGMCTKSEDGAVRDLLFPGSLEAVDEVRSSVLVDEHTPLVLSSAKPASFGSSQEMKEVFHHVEDASVHFFTC